MSSKLTPSSILPDLKQEIEVARPAIQESEAASTQG
jgi:hypothetical protein